MKRFNLVPFKKSWTYWFILMVLLIFLFFLMFGLDILVTYGGLDINKSMGNIYGHEITFFDLYFYINLFIWLQFFFSGVVSGFKWCITHIVKK